MTSIILQTEITLTGWMLEMEASIREAVNSTVNVATQEALGRFDTDGSAIKTGDICWTSKGQSPQTY